MHFGIFILFGLAGCQMAGNLPSVTTLDTDFQPISKGEFQRQVAFAGGMFDLNRGDLYVTYPFWHWSVPNVNTGFYVCNPKLKHRLARSQGYWNEDDNIFGSWPEESRAVIEKALYAQGYNIRETRKSYFEKIARKPRAELLLSLRVTDIKMNVCHIHEPITLQSLNRAGGEGVITVEWEVYDTIREQILGSWVTRGYGHIDEPLQNGEKAIFLAAKRDAAQHMGQSDWFRQIMTTEDPVDLFPESQYKMLAFSTKALISHKPLREHFASMRKAVITVHADLDHAGTGFFISDLGYALTAAKVVGEAEFVQISDTNGTKYRAKVLRTDERRNVALIKADIHDNFALPISEREYPDPLMTVYAIGTPFQGGYRATITKGIISANRYRASQNLALIQASVPTTDGYEGGPLTDEFGNVLGITYAEGNGETNFSVFLPIKEALKALNIKLIYSKQRKD